MQKSIKTIFLKLLISAALILTLTGCMLFTETTLQTFEPQTTEALETTEEQVPESISETTEQQTEETEAGRLIEIENEFNLFEKNTENINAIFNFIDENISESSAELATEMIYAVLKLCEDYKFEFTDKFIDNAIQEAIISTLDSYENIDLSKLMQSDNQAVKDIAGEAMDKKFRLISVEGFIMPIVDYRAYDSYRDYLTMEMNAFMDIKLDESERPSVMDAGIVIPVDDFIQRIIKSMDYVAEYPDSPRADEVEQFNKGRIYMYFSGIDNNPVFDSDLKILPDKLTEFEDIFTIYRDTDFGNLLGAYLDILAQENYIRTQNIDDFLNNID